MKYTALPTCPICGEGSITSSTTSNTVTYGRHSRSIEMRLSACDCCGVEQATTEDARFNKRAMLAGRKQVDALLSGQEIRNLRERLRINQTEAARLFGGGKVAFSKYENDDVAQSEGMDKLLRIVAEIPQAFEWLVRHADAPEIAERAQAQRFRERPNIARRFAVSRYSTAKIVTRSSSRVKVTMHTEGSNLMFGDFLEEACHAA